ncbi:MAG TPA: sodium:proton antiporter NhaD [Xylanibacter oryzae]|nr:sodium:proton antiporter NhaD [Xylanibacter oryzae]
MSLLTITICIVFVFGYLCIALESEIKINKAAIALLMCVACWSLYMVNPLGYIAMSGATDITKATNVFDKVGEILRSHLGDTAETLFFLMGAMTIVEIVDSNGGFNFVRDSMKTKSKRALLWRITFMTFFLSAVLDNLTTSIVMIMVLRKLVSDHKDRIIYASIVIIAANSGGAFSPIGDVTTIMLWIGNMITTQGIIKEVFIPSVISIVLPAFVLQYSLKGELPTITKDPDVKSTDASKLQRRVIFILGVCGLMSVPIFRYFTNLPPFMGILFVLGLLWTVTEIFYRGDESTSKRVAKLLSKIDMTTILFFLGILMAVSCLEEVGVLKGIGAWLNVASGGNHYIVTGFIGVVSSIIDNVPLVAGCIGMYPISPIGDMATDGIFWQLLAYCAGVGGSILIIGSAAGVVVMGLERITFGWYMKHVSWIALLGYLGGIFAYWIEKTFIFC